MSLFQSVGLFMFLFGVGVVLSENTFFLSKKVRDEKERIETKAQTTELKKEEKITFRYWKLKKYTVKAGVFCFFMGIAIFFISTIVKFITN